MPSRLARWIRLPLRWIPPSSVVPILSGASRGHRWIVGSATHGCWLGTYERRSQLLAAELANPGDTVWDIGANVGFFTLLFSRRVGTAGQVVAFEPLPRNLAHLRRHVELNRRANVEVRATAVGSSVGRARFATGASACEGMLSAGGELEVDVTTVDAVVAETGRRRPDLLKLDIEGGEVDALAGAARTLGELRPTVWVETHSARRHAGAKELLLASGYQLRLEIGTAPHGWGVLLADGGRRRPLPAPQR